MLFVRAAPTILSAFFNKHVHIMRYIPGHIKYLPILRSVREEAHYIFLVPARFYFVTIRKTQIPVGAIKLGYIYRGARVALANTQITMSSFHSAPRRAFLFHSLSNNKARLICRLIFRGSFQPRR